MSEESYNSPRRAIRRRNKPQKYGDFIEESPVKRKFEVDSDSSEDEDFGTEECHQKPTALFSSDDVEGQDMFQFKTRHTKLDLQNKVKSIISSPRVVVSPLKTPRKSFHRGSFASPMGKSVEATPKHVRDIIKKRIIKEVESESAESDFSDGSSDDFVPDGEDSASESKSSSESEPESDEEEQVKRPQTIKKQIVKNKNARRPKDSEYVVAPDNYFMMNSSKKIATSDHTLARLKNMNLHDKVDEETHISEEHKIKIAELNNSYKHLFDKWLYVLCEDFNIVLYGIGSKRSVLHQFQTEKLKDNPCIVVNGFYPSLTLKSILEMIVVDLLKNSHVPSNIGDVVSLIDSQLTQSGMDLFLMIHNIDGLMLRNAKAQAMLASIAQIKNVHTIATIDHINAPLLWDHSKLSKFNFIWYDVTTLLPYTVETSYETSLLSTNSGALQLSSLHSVYQSLTTNAKGIFKIIVHHQLENHKQPHYQGLPFKDLYRKCREQFLVSSDTALRAQLTEFLDHRLLTSRRADHELLKLAMDNALLKQFMEQVDS